MVRANAFASEKHANDCLHNPSHRGTHTMREIARASEVLGRRARATKQKEHDELNASDDDDDDDDEDGKAKVNAMTRDVTRVVDGVVMRVSERKRTKARRRERALARAPSASERWKTESRLAAGGSAGMNALRDARRAARALDGDGKRPSREDCPTVVDEGDLTFVDGWATGQRRAAIGVGEYLGDSTAVEGDGGRVRDDDAARGGGAATIGRKRTTSARRTKAEAVAFVADGCLSFDVDEV